MHPKSVLHPSLTWYEQESLGLKHLSDLFSSYIVEAHRLKSLYASQITLLVGLETEVIASPSSPSSSYDALQTLLDEHGDKIEYLVGSVHHVNEVPIDFSEEMWKEAVRSLSPSSPLSQPTPATETAASFSDGLLGHYFAAYFDAQLTIMERFHPEVIGHFDLCRLYVPNIRLDSPAYTYEGEEVWKKVVRNVDYAISYGACFEVNAAAFRKGWGTAYPGEEVLKVRLWCCVAILPH